MASVVFDGTEAAEDIADDLVAGEFVRFVVVQDNVDAFGDFDVGQEELAALCGGVLLWAGGAFLPELKKRYSLDCPAVILRKKHDMILRMAATATRILFVRADSIGDSLLATTTLPHVLRIWPGARVVVACQAHVAEVYSRMPWVAEIIPFEKGRLTRDAGYRDSVLAQIAGARFDVSINTTWSREVVSDLIAIGSNARERIAFEGDTSNIDAGRLASNNRFYTRLIPSTGKWKSELERYRDFLKGLGVEVVVLEPRLDGSDADRQAAASVFERYQLKPERTIALFASAQYAPRVVAVLGAALRRICEDQGFGVVALGSEADFCVNAFNLGGLVTRCVNLSGRTTICESAEILRACRMAVGTETGLAHLACAVGTPNVVVLGGGHFGRFMPYSALTTAVTLPLGCYGCNWVCRHSRVHCVKDVLPEAVEAAIRDRLTRTANMPRLFMQSADFGMASIGPKWGLDSSFLTVPMEVTVVLPEEAAVPASGLPGGVRVVHIARPAARPLVELVDVTRERRFVVSFHGS